MVNYEVSIQKLKSRPVLEQSARDEQFLFVINIVSNHYLSKKHKYMFSTCLGFF